MVFPSGRNFSPNYSNTNNFKPSAPPLEDGPNLHDDCVICYAPLGENEEDANSTRVTLAKGENCQKHYFHDLCLAKWISKSKDPQDANCPLCRQLVGRVTVIDMPVLNSSQEPAPRQPEIQIPQQPRVPVMQVPQQPRVPVMQVPQPLEPIYEPRPKPVAKATQPVEPVKPAAPQGPSLAERLVRGTASAAFGVFKWGGRNAWNLTTAGFNWVMSDRPVSDNHFDKRSITLLSRPAKIVKNFEERINDIRDDQLSIMLALISSTAAAGTYRKGEESLKRIELGMNLLEAQMKEIAEEFKKVLVEEKKNFS
jgi:hypothetical protein